MSMYELHYEGVNTHNLTTYRVLIPTLRGPGGECPLYHSYWPTAPLSSPIREDIPAEEFELCQMYGEAVHDVLTFTTPAVRERWWTTVKKSSDIQWLECPLTNDPSEFFGGK